MAAADSGLLAPETARQNATRGAQAAHRLQPVPAERFWVFFVPTHDLQNTGLSLSSDGLVSGTLVGSYPTGRATFRVEVADSHVGGHDFADGTFCINVSPADTFRFALDTLGGAWQGRLYHAQVFNLINGAPPYTFAEAANQWADLAAAGFALDLKSGMLAGVPISAGRLTFHVNCQDNNGTWALSRTGSGRGQDITLDVLANNSYFGVSGVSSGVVAASIKAKVGTGTGADSVKYAGLINLGAFKVADLKGCSLELRLGGWVSSAAATFDNNGKAGKFASINSQGLLKVAVSKDNISTELLLHQMLALVTIKDSKGGMVLQAGEVLPFAVQRSSKGTTYSYRTGPNPSGTFFLTSVTSKDDQAGYADAWKVGFIAFPGLDQSFSGDTADVQICAARLSTAVTGSGTLKSKADAKTATSILSLSIGGAKGLGRLVTSALGASETAIPAGANPGSFSAGLPFSMSLAVTDTKNNYKLNYKGEGVRQIHPTAKGWTEKQPK